MTPRRTILRTLAFLAPAITLAGCDLLGADPADARVEVDAHVIRTIVYWPISSASEPLREVTTKRLDEIDCLRSSPQRCRVEESITATVHNTGALPLYWNDCHHPLQRYGLGEWHTVMAYVCAGPALSVRPSIEPGDQRVFPVDVTGAPTGEYRVGLQLWDAEQSLPDRSAISPSFQLEPLPDAPRFQCPSDNRAELASRLAREALDAAAAGTPPEYIRNHLLLEREVPGFGGMFAEGGSLVVWLTDLSRSDAMTAAIRARYGRNAMLRRGDYSYSELRGWSAAVGPMGLLGVWSVGVDELTNRIQVRILNELIRPDAECFLRGIGMPAGMARIERP